MTFIGMVIRQKCPKNRRNCPSKASKIFLGILIRHAQENALKSKCSEK